MERPNDALNAWRKSTYSGSSGSECVEVGGNSAVVLVRDTKNRQGTVLGIGSDAWEMLTSALKASA